MSLVFRSLKAFKRLVSSARMLSTTQAGVGDTIPSTQHVSVDGTDIHYVQAGCGPHTVLMLPGALGSGATDFAPQLKHLNHDKYTLIAWDPQGYGYGQAAGRDWSGNFLLRDAHQAAKLMQKLDHTRYSLLGWSDGGITALLMAAHHPTSVRRVVQWGANAYLTEGEIASYQSIRDISAWSERMRTPFIQMYGERKFQELWENWIDNFCRFYTDHQGDVCRSALSRVTCPLLTVHGQKDPLVPQFYADYITQHVKGAELKNFPEGKHNLHMKYFKEVNLLIEDFLDAEVST